MSTEIKNILKTQGIRANGYGIIPKFVMLDREITIEAKGIYALFCSFAGSDGETFPNRNTILETLKISKTRFYNHFDVLKKEGYITVEQVKSYTNKFKNNVYTIESNPKKFFEYQEKDKKSNGLYNRIRFEDIESAGYGMLPRTVMSDERLPIESKAIYAYFCSFTGSGNTAFPRVSTVAYHLNISLDTYYKYYSLLEKMNYIYAEQRHINGVLGINDFYLVTKPNEKNVISGRTVVVSINHQYPTNKDTETVVVSTNHQYPTNEDTENEDTENKDTTINKCTINKCTINKYINPSINQEKTLPKDGQKKNNYTEKKFMKTLTKEIHANGLSLNYRNNHDIMLVAIRIITEYAVFSIKNSWENENDYFTYMLAVDCLYDLCTSMKSRTLNGQNVTAEKVIEKINLSLTKSDDKSFTFFVSGMEIIDSAMNDYTNALKETKIKNHFAYMQACIWTSFSTYREKDKNDLFLDGYM